MATSLARGTTVDALHAAALLDLHERSPTDAALNRAIDALSEAHALDAADARVQLDLSGALLLFAKRQDDPMIAMEAAEHALAVQVAPDTALHERAQRNAREGLAGAGIYASPPQSAPASDADAFAHLLSLLAVLATLDASDSTAQARSFASATQMANVLAQASGDGSVLRLVADARRACAMNCLRVGRAFRLIGEARGAFLRGDYAEARDGFAAVATQRGVLPQLAMWADVFAAGTYQRMENPRAAAALLRQLQADPRVPSSPMLAARVRWLAFTQQLRYGPGEARRDDAVAAVAAMQRVGDLEYWANCAVTLHELQRGNGELNEAVNGVRSLLRDPRFPRAGIPRLRAVGLLLDVAEARGYWRVAEALLRLETGPMASDFARDQRVEQIGYFLRTALDRGDTMAVDRWLPEMRRTAEGIDHPLFRPAAADFIATIEGGRLRHRDPSRAASVIEAAALRMERRPLRASRASAYADAARARLVIGDSAASEQLLERAVRQRLREVDDGKQRGAADAVRRLRLPDIDLLTMLQSRKDAAAALRWRRAQFGEHAPLVHPRLTMTLVGDSVVAWVELPRTTSVMHVLPIGGDELRRRMVALRASLQRQQSADTALRTLYAQLVEPLHLDFSRIGELLELEVDGVLQHVPLGALLDPADGRSLGARVGLKYRLRSAMPVRTAQRAAGAVLVVSDPATEVGKRRGLRRLPGADREAMEIARLHPRAIVLRDGAATVTAVRARLAESALLHVGAHAVPASRLQRESALLLAPDDAVPDGVWREQLISGHDGPAPSTVILAACASGDRAALAAGTEGMVGAWVDAGARDVVASLWPVADGATSEVMIRVHRALAAGRAAALALRDAQRQLEDEHGPAGSWRWAAWRVMGR